jgi:hypothetical protein
MTDEGEIHMTRNGWHRTAFGQQYDHYFDKSNISICHSRACFFALIIEEAETPRYKPGGLICKQCRQLVIKRKLKGYELLNDNPTYNDALQLATKCHSGQKRKYTGEPYITHPIAVASKFIDETYKIVAVLHDVVEDTDITVSDLMRHGYSTEICVAIYHITQEPNTIYLDYILKVKKNPIALAVKRADLLHNISTLKNGSLYDKYMLALWILDH